MHPARLARVTLAVVSSLVALAALNIGCGGAAYSEAFDSPVTEDAGGNGGDASALPDGASRLDAAQADAGDPTTWSPVCPASLPKTGTGCYGDNLQCEYGSASWNVSCDTVVQCQNGQWWSYQPSYEPCTPAPGPNSASCPSTFAAVPAGASCSNTALSCEYAQGRCACQPAFGGPIQVDAGTGGYWACTPEPGCPFPRPRLGSACASPGVYCTYEECSYSQTCSDGVWQGQPDACGAPAGGLSGRRLDVR